jgi:hypothetical protein
MPGPPPRIPNQAAKVTYATLISQKTGLSLAAVLAWVQGENGPADNFLGIMVPGTQTLERYATPEQGAAAVVQTLHEKRYAPVLATAASTNDPKVELAAIAASPWNGSGTKADYLHLLLGSLTANSNNPALAIVPGAGDTAPPLNIPNPLTGWVGDLTGWLQKESSLALAYVVLTVLGLALVIFGGLDTFGYAPGRVAGGLKPSVKPEPIPF